MSDLLRIGKTGRRNFTLPIDVAGEAIAVLAKRGAGKSNTAAVIAEELHGAGVQVVILDPVGAHWGLRSGADGKSEGLKIPIIGGQHGDIPLESTAGPLVADVAADTGSSLLLDLSDFPSKTAVATFVAAFGERLFRRKARDRRLLHLVLEEADEFAPQTGTAKERRMKGAIDQLVRRGRSRGIGITMVSQRSAKLNKDVLTQADLLVAMRTTGPQDIAAIKAWIAHRADAVAEVIESLPALETGEAWFWGPERDLLERVQVRMRETFDSSSTPKHGQKRTEPKAAAAIDLAQLGEQIQATADRAKENDPAELRKRIRQLEAEVRRAEQAGPSQEDLEAAREQGRRAVELELRDHIAELGRRIEAAKRTASPLQDAAQRIIAAAEQLGGLEVNGMPKGPGRRPTSATGAPVARTGGGRRHREASPARAPAPAIAEDAELTGPQRKILTALAWFRSVGIDAVSRPALGALAGYKKGGHYDSVVSSLRTAGLIDYPAGNKVAATSAGAEFVTVDAPLTLDELQGAWLAVMNGPQQRVLRALIAAWPDEISREDLLEETGYQKGGHFDSVVSSVKTMGAAEYPARGYVRASANVFPEGLR